MSADVKIDDDDAIARKIDDEIASATCVCVRTSECASVRTAKDILTCYIHHRHQSPKQQTSTCCNR